ncbi:MAG: gliding motility-associated C-terminal domain-containing protein [Bacteroidales bacterium]|nr:gliding motility-associated C-terminal domain-containing protein [Bacteroidales bacterium]
MGIRYLLLILIAVFISVSIHGQYPGEIWYFGQNSGLDFNTNSPTPLNDGMISSIEGCATMTDTDGNILFYTDGVTVWDKDHNVMENGEGLAGHNSSTQVAVIAKQPGDNPYYFIFTTPKYAEPEGLCYSKVDISKNNGLGEITLKNIQLTTPVSEKLTAIRHANNLSTWIITHKYNSDAFYAYLLSESGLSMNPVISNTGATHQGGTFGTYNAMGYMKSSPSCEKLALAIYDMGIFELLNFNNQNGVISHQLTFSGYQKSYAVEFSPNNHLLYVKELYSGEIFQYNLNAGSPGEIFDSKTLIGVATASPSNPNYVSGALQLGKDDRIYVSKYMEPFLGRIENPDVVGTDCNFVDEALYLNGKQGLLGFPYAGKDISIAFTYEPDCYGDSTYFYIENTNGVNAVEWDFGDPASGENNYSTSFNPYHVFTEPGEFVVTLTLFYGSDSTTVAQEVIIHETPQIDLGNDTIICSGENFILDPGGGYEAFLWQDGSQEQTYTVTESGLYWVEVFNEFGCSDRDSIEVLISDPFDIDLGEDTTFCSGDSLLLHAGSGFDDYLWQDGSGDSTYTVTQTGTYWVMVTDSIGCTATDSIQVTVLPDNDLELGEDSLACFGETVILDAGEGYDEYLWQDGSTNQTFEVTQEGTYWVEATNICGTDRDTIAVAFTDYYDISLGEDTAFCYGQSLLLAPDSSYSQYLWQDGSTDSVYIANHTGWYWLEVTDAYGCTATDSIYIEVFMDYEVSIGKDTAICRGEYVFLDAPGGFEHYLWQNGDTATSIIADTAGIYWCEVTDEHGCAARDSLLLDVHSLPADFLGEDTILCPGTSITLRTDSLYSAYWWPDGSQDSVYAADTAGLYWLRVADEIGCEGTDTIRVEAFEKPAFDADSAFMCPGETVELQIDGGYQGYEWTGGSGDSIFVVNTPGYYWVDVTTRCGVFRASIYAGEYKLRPFDLGADTMLCKGENLRIEGPAGYTDYYWPDGSTGESFVATEPGTYRLEAFDGHCWVSDSLLIEPCPSIWIPNAFTPNGDQHNDYFRVDAQNPAGIYNFKLLIFNRWGQHIYTLENVNDRWDGKIKGNPCSEGTYFWIAEFETFEEQSIIKQHNLKGSITLLR